MLMKGVKFQTNMLNFKTTFSDLQTVTEPGGGGIDEEQLEKAVEAAVESALTKAKESGEFDGDPGLPGKDGSDGEDGISPTVSVSAITGGNRITITDVDGTKTVDVMNGVDGKDGSNGQDGYTPVKGKDYFDGESGRDGVDGSDGVGIASAVLNADYTLTLNFTDGTKYTTTSIRGATGAAGSDGKDGVDGYTPVKGVDYFDGKDGSPGTDGLNGYTPVKGVDYFDGKDGQDGAPGAAGSPGADGVGIESIGYNRTPDENGEIHFVIRLTDGRSYSFTLRNGKDGQDGAPGSDGKDGVSATHSWSGTTLTVTSASGTSSANLKGEKGDKGDTGDPGSPGSAGKDGTSVTVKSVSESTADSGSNVVTFSDGNTITIKNGSKGSAGASGSNGKDGSPGADGVGISSVKQTTTSTADGGTNVVTVTLTNGQTATFNVKNGSKGSTGAAGKDGSDATVTTANIISALGYTPANATTVSQLSAEIHERMTLGYHTDGLLYVFLNDVPVGTGVEFIGGATGDVTGVIDSAKNIILTGVGGDLADGTYTIKYEKEDGTFVDGGSLVISSGPAYTNLLPTSIDNTGAVYNGTGFKNGYRLTGGAYPCESADTAYFCTGYIPYTKAQANARVPMYVKGVTIDLSSVPKYLRVAMVDAYNTTDGYIDTLSITGAAGSTNQITIQQLGDRYYKLTPNSGFISGNFDDWKNKDLQFIRWSFPGSGNGVIFTVDEPIE